MRGPYAPDPRDQERCRRAYPRDHHTFRIAALWPDLKLRCVHCGRTKGERIKR